MPCLDKAIPKPVGVKPTLSAASREVGSLPLSNSPRMNVRAWRASAVIDGAHKITSPSGMKMLPTKRRPWPHCIPISPVNVLQTAVLPLNSVGR